MARRLEGKVALITGGASGIGEYTAKLFCQHGAKVVIADIQDELGHSVCEALGPSVASFIHCDVTNEIDVQNAVDHTAGKHGKLDIMFNNAGVTDEPKTSILENSVADFERVLRTNIIGAFLGTKHAARVMIPARRGSIISTASISSIVGAAGSHAYTCSKHAVAGLTKNACIELGKFGIRVNCVSPYIIGTPLSKNFLGMDNKALDRARNYAANLKGVSIELEDIAQAVLYLGSDDSAYVSGHNLPIDGGFTVANASFRVFETKL